jgi:SAM-dependent methyltransferase
VDAEAMPFADAAFDLIIANHLLEHVSTPSRALAEFERCLAPGGMLIAQTPYAPHLTHTFELDSQTTSEFRTLFYGQADHVRLFGRDIARYFREAGLRGDLLAHEQLLGDMDALEFGCNRHEPFFAFSKPEFETADA